MEKKLEEIRRERERADREFKSLIYQQKLADSKQERRERTHRIATKGAMLEKYFDCESYSFDDTEELLKTFANFVKENRPKKFKEKYHGPKQNE
ncbi:hypothetical protein IW510_19030 [Enterococcus sp. BWR-S5]|nr:hypothetical protein [Enterococcus sp. BWR-S5]